MAERNVGKITQIIGAVLDIKFPEGTLPEINSAIDIQTKDGGRLVVEVAQHLGDDTVRCIAMGPTDGLIRGMEAIATGGPISVPVGEVTLGRIFNVLGEPIDKKPMPEGVKRNPIHRKAPAFAEQATETESLETGIKVVKPILQKIIYHLFGLLDIHFITIHWKSHVTKNKMFFCSIQHCCILLF